MFTGTASVARAFKGIGYRVIANDLLKSSEVFATAALRISNVPPFTRLQEGQLSLYPDRLFSGDAYDRVLHHLNNLKGFQGFFYREYAPTASMARGTPRQYFTDANASKIDAIRLTIRQWWLQNLITQNERSLLLSSLILAMNEVANVAGTYGYFLRDWYDKALEPLQLGRLPITPGSEDHDIYREDANELARKIAADVVYLDPPYTKRQYSAYYHVLETIAEDDEPQVWGATGLRERNGDVQWASQYCYKTKAASALQELVDNLQCRYIFLSYSSDGHISHEQLMDILGRRGIVTHWSVSLSRYKSNNNGMSKEALLEQLYAVRCR